MKRFLLILVILVVVIGAAFFVLQKTAPVSPVIPTGPSQPPADMAVTTLHAQVLITSEGQSQSTEIPVSTTTPTGQTITTGTAGRALVEVDGNKTVLDYSSTLMVPALVAGADQTSMTLATGGVWSRVEKLFQRGQYFNIKTKNAVAAVRGTSFSMQYVGATTTLIILEGTVAITALDLATGAPDERTTVEISPGFKAVRVGDGPIVVSLITAADRASAWYQFMLTNGGTDTGAALTQPPVPQPTAGGATRATTSPAIITPVVPPQPPAQNPPPPQRPAPKPAAPVVSQPPAIYQITPTSYSFKSRSVATDVKVTLTGVRFSQVKTVKVGTQTVSSMNIVSDSELRFVVDTLNTGTHDVAVIDNLGQQTTFANGLTVRAN